MKYWIRIILALSLFMAVPVLAKTVYLRTSLTGGGADALDQVDGDDLSDNDTAIVTYGGEFYFYELDSTSGATENPPAIISPDLNPGTKRWILQGIHEAGSHVRQNLITNSEFGVCSDSTIADYSDANTGFSALHPVDNCTDPDNDQDNTTGWAAVNATLTSEAGGVTGNRLKVDADVASYGIAQKTGITLTAGKLYRIKGKCGADVGDSYRYYLFSSTYGGNGYDSGVIAGAGAGNWDTYDIIWECVSTQTDWRIMCRAEGNNDNAYFDNISLSEITPAFVISGVSAFDGWRRTSTLDIYRWQQDSTHCKGFYGVKVVKGHNNIEQFIWPVWDIYYLNEFCNSKFEGRTVTFGAWVYDASGDDDNIKLVINDSDGTTESSFVTSNSLVWVSVTRTIGSGVTWFHADVNWEGDAGDVAYVSRPMLVFGSSIGEGNYIQPPGEILWVESGVTMTDYSGVTVSADIAINIEVQTEGKIPKGVKAVYAQITGKCATTDKYIALLSAGGGISGPRIEDVIVAAKNHTAVGWVPCDANGDIYIERDGTFYDVVIKILGVEIR